MRRGRRLSAPIWALAAATTFGAGGLLGSEPPPGSPGKLESNPVGDELDLPSAYSFVVIGHMRGAIDNGPFFLLDELLAEVAKLYGLKFNAENIARWYFKEMSLLEAQAKPAENSDDGNFDIIFAEHIDD